MGDPGNSATGEGEDDQSLLAGLRNGDELTLRRLVELYEPGLLHLAQSFVRDRPTAQEVVQETWLAALAGASGFEGRSSLKTWIFRILINQAKRRGLRDARSSPFSALTEESVSPNRFRSDSGPLQGHWKDPPRAWESLPEQGVLDQELRRVLRDAVDALPPMHRAVITLRDIEGWPAKAVCNVLDLTDTNQRVLLHRARTEVRKALALYLANEE